MKGLKWNACAQNSIKISKYWPRSDQAQTLNQVPIDMHIYIALMKTHFYLPCKILNCNDFPPNNIISVARFGQKNLLSCIAICYYAHCPIAHERLIQSAVWCLKQRHDLGNLKVLAHAGWHQLSHSPECLWSHNGQRQHGKTPHLIPSLPANQPGIPMWYHFLFMTLLPVVVKVHRSSTWVKVQIRIIKYYSSKSKSTAFSILLEWKYKSTQFFMYLSKKVLIDRFILQFYIDYFI